MLAALCERLIAYGHINPFKYTPKQAVAYAELARSRLNEELKDQFTIMQVANHGKKQDVKKLLGDLEVG